MAQFSTKFYEYSNGNQPSGWTKRWNTDSTFTKQEELSTHLLRLTQGSDGDAVLSWGDVGTPTNVEVLVKMRTTQRFWYQNGIYVRGSGNNSNKNGYYFQMFENASGSTGLVIEKWQGNTWSALTGELFNWSANTWYWCRFQKSGSTLRAKFWQDGNSEPSGWTLSTSDSGLSGGGWVGLGAYEESGTKRFDAIGVGTNGDPAVIFPHNFEIGTAHALNGNTELESVSLSQVHKLAVDDVISETDATTNTAPEIQGVFYGGYGLAVGGSSYYGQNSGLAVIPVDTVADDLTSETELESVELSQVHHLEVNDVISETEVDDDILLVRLDDLSVQDVVSQTELESVELIERITLEVDDVVSITETPNVTISTQGFLGVNEPESITELDNVDLFQKQTLEVDDAISLTELETADVVELKTLEVDGLVSTTELDDTAITQNHILIISDLNSETELDSLVLFQSHLLALQDLISETELDEVTVISPIIASPLVSETELESVKLLVKYTLDPEDLLSDTELTEVVLELYKSPIKPYEGIAGIERPRLDGDRERTNVSVKTYQDSVGAARDSEKPRVSIDRDKAHLS